MVEKGSTVDRDSVRKDGGKLFTVKGQGWKMAPKKNLGFFRFFKKT